MKKPFALHLIAAVATLTLFASWQALGVAIAGLWNTGVDNTGSPHSVSVGENHYTVTSETNLTDSTIGTIATPAAWTAEATDARWIGSAHAMDYQPPSTGYAGLAPDPIDLYNDLTFTLDTFSSAWLSGSWASDNHSWICLNGTMTAERDTKKPFEEPLVAFQVTDSNLFVQNGQNSPELWVHNDSQIVNGSESIWGNPTGPLVSGLHGEYQPVPDSGATILLLGLGLLGLAGLKRTLARI